MTKRLPLFAAALAAIALSCQTAKASDLTELLPSTPIDGVAIGVGIAATVGYFALDHWRWKWENVNGFSSIGAVTATTFGCIAVSPMVGTVVLNRPLTQREAGVLFGSCIIPFVGGWLVNKAYEAHSEWDPAYTPPHEKKKKHAKM